MSSKKVYNTIGLEKKTWALVEKKGAREKRSRSFVIEQIVREFFSQRKKEEKSAD